MINEINSGENYAVLESENSRKVILPKLMETAGVESDKEVRKLNFKFPKIVDGVDLTQMQVRINFINSRGEKGQYIVDDLKECETDETYVIFSWPFSRLVTRYRGLTKFVVCAVKMGEDGTITTEWNTALAQLQVLEGLEITQADFSPEEKDIVSQLIDLCRESTDKAAASAQQALEEAEKVLTYGPEIGENGNWFIKGEDTGKPSRGEKGEPGMSGGSQIVDLGEISPEGTIIPADKGAILLGDGNPAALVRNIQSVDLLFFKNYVYLNQQAIYSAALLGNGAGLTLFVTLGEDGQYTAYVQESSFPYYSPSETVTRDSMLILRKGKYEWELIGKENIADEICGTMREVANFVTAEDALEIEITKDKANKPLDLRYAVGVVVVPSDPQAAQTNTTVWGYAGGNTALRRTIFTLTATNTTTQAIKINLTGLNGFVVGTLGSNNEQMNPSGLDAINGISFLRLEIKTEGNKFPAGTQVRLWGTDR